MDLSISKINIKDILKKTVTLISSIIKESVSLPNFWLYIILSVILTIFFIFLTFPYEVLIKKQLKDIGSNIGTSLEIGNIDFGIFGSTNVDDMRFILKDGSEIKFKEVDLDVSYIKAIFSNAINGEAAVRYVRYTKEQTSFNGIIKSDFSLDFDSYKEYPSKGRLSLNLQNVKVDGLTIKGFDIPTVKFTNINASARVSKNRVNIQNIKIAGPDINGSITGFITLSKFARSSRLNLNIDVDSGSMLLQNYKIFLGSFIDKEERLKIAVKGTLANPKIDLPKKSDLE